MAENNISVRSYLLLILLSIVWGSSFILMKKALISFHPYDLACLRIMISAICFAPFLALYKNKIPWNKWKIFLAIGLTGTGIPAFMYFIAQSQINSSISGLLNSLTPIWTFIFGIVFFKSAFSKNKFAGVLIGFIGASLLFLFKPETGQNQNILYGLFIVLGSMCYGISGNLVKHHFQDTKSIIISSVSFTMVGLPALIIYISRGTYSEIVWTDQVYYSIGALLILTVLGTVLATIFFYKLIQDTSAVFGSSVAYIMPLIAIAWGYADGETIGPIIFASIALILSGVYLIRKQDRANQ